MMYSMVMVTGTTNVNLAQTKRSQELKTRFYKVRVFMSCVNVYVHNLSNISFLMQLFFSLLGYCVMFVFFKI